MELRKLFVLVILNVLINGITWTKGQYFGLEHYKAGGLSPDDDEEIITDVPESDFDDAKNLDAGEYTTQLFRYENFGFTIIQKEANCLQQYIKCILDQGVHTPVCSVNDAFEIPSGYITYDSTCDVYLDNCRRMRHFWRILDYGRCVHYSHLHASVHETKRSFIVPRPWTYIFKVMSWKGHYTNLLNQAMQTYYGQVIDLETTTPAFRKNYRDSIL